jgi:[acyl-carrier-protein] S-malonyltransferase
MSGGLAYIFPGQGSQNAGMGKDLAANFAAAREVFAAADEALGFSLSRLCFEGPAEDLQLTENTQPAILTVSAAALSVLKTEGMRPATFVAGHSLGEYSALVASGALAADEAAWTVRARGRYMQEAVPVGVGAMAAILGLDLSAIEQVCADAEESQVCSPANINSPGQVVIAGNTAAIDRAIELAKERGAKRAIKLNVSAPFHCRLMMPAQERLAADLSALQFQPLNVPLITNVDATAIESATQASDALVRQVSAPVRWLQSMELLIGAGVDTFVEIGPGKVLCGLLRQIDRSVRCLNIEDAASLKSTMAALAA